jgi:hypothetical protein
VRKRIRNAPRGHPGRRNHSLIAAAETSTLPQNFGSSALVLRIPERPVIAVCPAHHFGCLQTQYNTHRRLLVKSVATYVMRRSTRPKIGQSVWLPGPAHRRSPDLGAGLAARAARDPGWPPWPTPSTHTRMIASTALRATSPAQSPTSPGHGWPSSLPNPAPPGPARPRRSDDLDASIQQALRKLHQAVAGDPPRPGQPPGSLRSA